MDDGWLATLGNLDGPIQRRAELIRLRNRPKPSTLSARQRGEVWRRVFKINTDALILNWALPPL